MSGILERLEQKLDQLLALQVAPVHTAQPSMGLMPATQPPADPTPVALTVPASSAPNAVSADPLSFAPPVQAAVTSTMITDLIQPHLNNPAIKAAMGNVLTQMNIPGLPAAREDQFPALYQAFQQIIALAAAPQPAAAGNSAIPETAPAVGGMSIL